MGSILKKITYLGLLIGCSFSPILAQINTGEMPPAMKDSKLKVSNQDYLLNIGKPDLNKLGKEDRIEDAMKDIPWRFGVEEQMDLDLLESGTWTDRSDGTSQLRVKIIAAEALSINLNFSDFQLSNSAKLFAYNENFSDYIGAITSKNNKISGEFSIRPIAGDVLYLELICPTTDKENQRLNLSGIVYGYRSLKDKGAKAFGSSGNCNIDVNCGLGDQWQDIKRSVALLLTANNTRFCSGALVNNVRRDSTPYFLTAAHCGVQSNSIFLFNYESPNCSPNSDGNTSNTISGAIGRAFSNNSDFQLFELSVTPPSSYGVFYAGWDASNIAHASSTAIHHPSGDVKKISRDNDLPITSGYYTTTGTTHWTVANWEEGTTEGGSSGSPLFDPYQRIIGQLHGGNASCSNNAEDYYGKFAVSWDAFSSNSSQLKFWLDPDNTGTQILDGLDIASSPYSSDLSIIGIQGLDAYLCGDSIISPTVLVKNNGNSNITSFNVSIQFGGFPASNMSFSGNLLRSQVTAISFPNTTVAPGKFNLLASINSSSPGDVNAVNDTLSKSFIVNSSPIIYTLSLKTDDYGNETTWDIVENSNGVILSRGGPYAANTGGNVYNETLCLYDSCMQFRLYDSFGDGFNDPSGTYGNGYALIKDNNGDTVLFENSFFGSVKILNFCVTKLPTAIAEAEATENFVLYPNPLSSDSKIQIEYQNNFRFRIYGLSGQLIRSGNKDLLLNTPIGLKAGVYFIELRELEGKPIGMKKLIVY